MKAVRGVDGAAALVDVDEPPGWGELVDVRSASICASDLMYLGFGTTKVLGHELAGELADGTAVAVEAMWPCGGCERCRDGAYNLCETMAERALGVSVDGGMAEQFRVPAESLVPVPDGLDVRDAALIEPATVAWHALRLAGVGPDTSVAVVGAGALGLLAVAGAREMGAPAIGVEARHPHQKEAAERFGGHVGADDRYDVVIEAAGSADGLVRATDLVAPRGTVCVLGVHVGNLEVPWMNLFYREASLLPSLGYCTHGGRKEMADAAAMLATRPEIPDALVTHRFPLADAEEAFRVAADRRSGAIRVMIEP